MLIPPAPDQEKREARGRVADPELVEGEATEARWGRASFFFFPPRVVLSISRVFC